MFDIGFGELVLVFVIGLIVLGPQRLPVAVKTIAGWVRALRSLATTVQNELTQELKLQEFQDSLKKVEKASLNNLTPELKASMDELREAAESMKRTYTANDPEKAHDEAHTIHNPIVKDNEAAHEGVTPATAENQASASAQKPAPAVEQPVDLTKAPPASTSSPADAAPSSSSEKS
ncbi:Sec-independent protein translocase protein TatB [Atlantibacter sp.]|uniref:Sec-independent protein translocase protein TatB n=1 Tax=Atlantibacter sp. TaxID=1903473 RepID=UPI0028A615F5|nr:Sec-independent protein translocase protein TatB [Atlantibacter sp.]